MTTMMMASAEPLAHAPGGHAKELSIRGLRKDYHGVETPVVDSVSLEVPSGEMLVLLGPSGCGKTTTLRMVSGLVEPTGGQILVGGRDITKMPVHRRNMGMVFQSYALFPHMTAVQNVAYGLGNRRVGRREADQRAHQALEMVGLGHLARRKPKDMSGGQQQRVALARALVIDPSVLLLDEPLSNLDAKLRESMRDEIRRLQLESGSTTVFVTHDQNEALAVADKVAVMESGQVRQFGTPDEIYNRPTDTFVARFIGRGNVFTGVVSRLVGIDEALIEVPGLVPLVSCRLNVDQPTPRVGAEATILIRPHRLTVAGPGVAATADGDVTLRARTVKRIYTGDAVALWVDVSGVEFEIELPTGAAALPPVDEEITLVIPRSAPLVVTAN